MLTVNAGSSSLKVELLVFSEALMSNSQPVVQVVVAGIGGESSVVCAAKDQPEYRNSVSAENHAEAWQIALEMLAKSNAFGEVRAVGHRVVHGGTDFTNSVEIDDAVQDKLAKLTALDPHHMPAALELIALLRAQFPDIPHVACFDTSFFRDIPRVAQMTSLPREYESLGVRRFGFHGLSYQNLQATFRSLAGEAAVNGRVIYAHLGSGASLVATRNGQPQDMTMGFSPASGVLMSSRSGDIDPALPLFLQQQKNMAAEDFDHMINFEAGLLGVSGLSNDMRVLIEAMDEHEGAREAVLLFCHQVAKSIASLSAAIGGLDSLIFSGGIGENAPLVRKMVCEQLAYMGISLDTEANQRHADLISSSESAIGVHVIASHESQTIVQEVRKLIQHKE